LPDDPQQVAGSLREYFAGFSPGAAETTQKFSFDDQITRLGDADLLYLVMGKFADIDLHPDVVSNLQMGYTFEELIRRFSDQSNETAGEHFTPREVIRLMVDLIFVGDGNELRTKGSSKPSDVDQARLLQLVRADHAETAIRALASGQKEQRRGAHAPAEARDRNVARLSEYPRGPTTSCTSMTRSRFCAGSFMVQTLRFGRVSRSCEVAPKRSCHSRTTARNCPTASRRTDRAVRASGTMKAIVRGLEADARHWATAQASGVPSHRW